MNYLNKLLWTCRKIAPITPNLIQSVEPHTCTIGRTQYKQSIIIPSNGEIVLCPLHEVDELTTDTVNQLCQYEPEVIILATGDNIIFPDPEILTDLLKKKHWS